MWLTIHRLLRALSETDRRKTPRRPRVSTFRPRLEALEERTLLSNYTAGNVTELVSDISAANAAGGTNTITLTAATSSPYILDDTTGPLPEITANDSLTINTSDGANRTIERSSSASAFRLFTVNSGASLTLQNLTLTGGLAEEGGGIFNLGILEINNCTLADNSVTDFVSSNVNGGGIYNGGTANVSNSTLSGNSATPGNGAGIYNSGTVNLSNSTLANNTAGDGGGGIYNVGTVNVSNSTLAGNSGFGIFNVRGGSVTLNNTIVAPNFNVEPSEANSDLYLDSGSGSTFSGSNDFIANSTYLRYFGTSSKAGNPLLAPLGNYGGPTQTMALLPGSPAIDAGSNALAVDTNGNPLTTDQRGQPRIVGNTVDIGAFESQGFTLTASRGSNQSANAYDIFPQTLTVTVTANNPLEPVDGGVVTFTAPNSGASAGLTGATHYWIAVIPVVIRGGSAAVPATANGIVGSYTVTATASGASTPADFSLANNPPVVSSPGVDSSDVRLTDMNFVSVTNLTPVGSTLYFEADDGVNGPQLWRTDGQPGDAVLVMGGASYVDPSVGAVEEVQLGRWLYFFTDNGDSNGEETYTLWRNDSMASPTDGKSSSEAILTIPGPTNDWGPYQLKAVGNDLYFGTYSFTDAAWELWKVTGADSPNVANLVVTQLQSSNPSSQIDSNGPNSIWAAGSNLYFTADAPGTTNIVLWGSDGTPDGTAPVRDDSGGLITDGISGALAVGSDLYTITDSYNAQGSFVGGTLWRVSGLEETAIATVGGRTGIYVGMYNYGMTAVGDSVYFITSDPAGNAGYTLWKCTGSTVTMVWQAPLSYDDPVQIVGMGSEVYFTDVGGKGSSQAAAHLWKTDGTDGGTLLLKEFRMPTTSEYVPFGLTAVRQTVYLDGPDGMLWQSGGSPESTQSTGISIGILDVDTYGNYLNSSPGTSSPLKAIGSSLYFTSDTSGWLNEGRSDLWRLNNPPVLNSAVSSATDTSISGNFSETAEPNTTITLNFYADSVPGPSGYGPGQISLGSTTVTTDANDNAAWAADLAVGSLAGQWITATATDANGNTSGFAFDVQATAASSQTYAQYLQAALPQSSSTANSMTIQASASDTPATVIAAVNGLTNVTQPVTIILDLGGGSYSTDGVTADPPPNITFVVQNGTLDPDYPALTVAGGQVFVVHCTLTTSGNAPTLLVTGGNVTLRDDEISQTSTASTQPAIAVTGGTVNLGTATTPGHNTLSVNNSGNLVSNTSGKAISNAGNTFVIGGTVESKPSLSFTTLMSSSASSDYGHTVTFTATVASDMPGSATPTGSVDFFDTTTSTDLGRVTLSGGIATLSTSALGAGTHVIQAIYSGDTTFLSSIDTQSQVVIKATPSFSLVAPPTIIDGTSNTRITGAIAAGSVIPPSTETVTVTVNGASYVAAINPDGTFAVSVPTASLGTGAYSIGYFYAGDNNFTSASATAKMDVTNGVLALFNQSKAKKAGSTIPIQIELVSASGQDLSSVGITVTAVGMAATTDTTDTTGSIDPSLVGALQPVQAAGNSNPGNVFREQGGTQPYYMYNLQTPTGLTAGTYRLYFQVQGDPLWQWVTFSVS